MDCASTERPDWASVPAQANACYLYSRLDLLRFLSDRIQVFYIDVTPFIGPGFMRVGGCGHAAAPY